MPEADDNMSVTVALVTRNRKNDLRRALHSVLEQDAAPEIIVLDDASTDGTSEMLREEFSSVSIHRQEHALGTTLARNLVTSLADSDIVVHLDDDAYFPSRTTVTQTVEDFDHPRIGIVAVPFFDVASGQRSVRNGRAPDDGTWVLATYTGAAYAARTSIFRHVGGYDGEYRMYGEERDLSLRLLAEGFVTRMGRADPALHTPSAIRSLRRQDILGRRNEIVWAWSSFPAPWHLVYIAGYMVMGIRAGIRVRRLRRMIRGMISGFRAIPSVVRDPVSRETFALDRRLRRKGSLRLSEIESKLPPLGKASQEPRTPRAQRSIASS
jgi:glycosyltransferase involved in cell wall biosynthesis